MYEFSELPSTIPLATPSVIMPIVFERPDKPDTRPYELLIESQTCSRSSQSSSNVESLKDDVFVYAPYASSIFSLNLAPKTPVLEVNESPMFANLASAEVFASFFRSSFVAEAGLKSGVVQSIVFVQSVIAVVKRSAQIAAISVVLLDLNLSSLFEIVPSKIPPLKYSSSGRILSSIVNTLMI